MNSNPHRQSVIRDQVSAAALVAVLGVVGAMAGCNDSQWKTAYTPAAQLSPSEQYRGAVKIREVPWERVQATLSELHAEVVASDVALEDWPADRKAARQARLLRGLQVTADPRTVEVLGRSEFRSTDNIRPNDGKLAEVARSVGADTVVWSSLYMGQTDVIRSEPVTEFTNGSYTPRSGGPSRTYSDTSTVYVPVYVKADERAWVAYFLRDKGSAQAQR